MAATVKIHHEVMESFPGGWSLCFQQVTYHYDDDAPEEGFRFIWRRPNGHLQAARGQARLPDIAIINRLMEQAQEDGWA